MVCTIGWWAGVGCSLPLRLNESCSLLKFIAFERLDEILKHLKCAGKVKGLAVTLHQQVPIVPVDCVHVYARSVAAIRGVMLWRWSVALSYHYISQTYEYVQSI